MRELQFWPGEKNNMLDVFQRAIHLHWWMSGSCRMFGLCFGSANPFHFKLRRRTPSQAQGQAQFNYNNKPDWSRCYNLVVLGLATFFFKKKDHQVSHAAKNLSSTHQEKFKQLKSPFQSNHVHSCILWDSAFFSTDAYFISRNNLFSLLALWNCLVQ